MSGLSSGGSPPVVPGSAVVEGGRVDFELIAESIPHIVWEAGPDGSTEYFNRFGTMFTGLPPEANYGWGWLSLIHPEDVERAQREWEQALSLIHI